MVKADVVTLLTAHRANASDCHKHENRKNASEDAGAGSRVHLEYSLVTRGRSQVAPISRLVLSPVPRGNPACTPPLPPHLPRHLPLPVPHLDGLIGGAADQPVVFEPQT